MQPKAGGTIPEHAGFSPCCRNRRKGQVMSQAPMQDRETRIAKRAEHLWEADGRRGRIDEYRDAAKELLAIEDNPQTAKKPLPDPSLPAETVEPLVAVENQGEFPTLTDQGEEQTAPRRREPTGQT